MRNFAIFFFLTISCMSTSELSSGPFDIERSNAWISYLDTLQRFSFISASLEFDQDTIASGQLLIGSISIPQDIVYKKVADELGLSFEKTYFHWRDKPDGWDNRQPIGMNKDTIRFEINPEYGTPPNSIFTECFGVELVLRNQTHSFDTTFANCYEAYLK